MNYFYNKKNVKDYISMSEGYDGTDLIEVLKKHLPSDSTLLELGMGPGRDLDILSKIYKTTGSDYSEVFLELYKERNKFSELLELDAVNIQTNRKFDCIYSNKVLHHLTIKDLKKSFIRQSEVLNNNGILFHSFWYGDKEDYHRGLRFVYYNQETISKCIGSEFKVLELKQYDELSEDDSFYIVLRKWAV